MPIDGLPGGDFSGCVREMTGNVSDPEGFCAWKIHELTGKWPAEEGAPPPPDGTRNTEYLNAKLSEGKTGSEWGIVIIGPAAPDDLLTIEGAEYVRSQNGLLYEVDGIRESAARWNGVKVYDNHLTDEEFDERAGMRSFLTEGVGVIKFPHFNEETRELCARLVIVDNSAAEKLKNAYDKGVLEYIGLSVDTLTQRGKAVTHEGKRYPVVKAFEHILSLDIVSEPAAGGKFTRLLAAKRKQEVTMTVTESLVKQWIAEALAAPDTEQEEMPEVPEEEITPEDVGDVMMEEVEAIIEEAEGPVEAAEEIVAVAEEVAEEVADVVEEEEEAPAAAESAQVSALSKKVREMEAKLAQAEHDRKLEAALNKAKLGPHRAVVEAAFRGRMWRKDELMTTIRRAKEAQAASDPSGQVTGAGGVRLLNARGSMSPLDKATIGFMQIMAQRGDMPGFTDLRAIENISHEYVRARVPEAMRAWSKTGRDNYRPWDGKLTTWLQALCGYNPLSLRAKEANDVSSITKNAVNLFLAAVYSVREEWWSPIVRQVTVDTLDNATLIRAYGLSNLSKVAAGGPYTDLELSDDEETASHQKYGNTVSVKLEDMLDDKVDVISQIPKMISDSWYNTKSALASGVFTVNTATGPVLSDSGALFNATATTTATGHANLLTATLSFTAYGAARTAMRKQTTQKLGAGRRLLITPKFLLVPADLETTALQIRNTEQQTNTGNNDVNPYYQQFEVLVVPDWTDTNNWALAADPVLHPAIYDIRVRGYEVPQVFTAGDESSGAVFTNDTWKYKTRLMTFVFSSTYECLPVSDFRALHKSNV